MNENCELRDIKKSETKLVFVLGKAFRFGMYVRNSNSGLISQLRETCIL